MQAPLPQDPMMLFSFINMKLRDEYPSLEELCEDMGLDQEQLKEQLLKAGFEYNAQANKFW